MNQALCMLCTGSAPQVTKQVEREVLNHRSLLHPHVLQFREVRDAIPTGQLPPAAPLF
jgi:hypothetical protein